MEEHPNWSKARLGRRRVIIENTDNILEEFCCEEEQRNGTAPRVWPWSRRGFVVVHFFFLPILLGVTFLRNCHQYVTTLL